jgi:HTH-type transcriptional regulator/antitoxin HipB
MRIRNTTDLGAFIRDRRAQLGLDQVELAERAGTSRKWLIEEQGKPRAEIGLILRTLKALGVSLDLKTDAAEETPSPKPTAVTCRQTPDIDSVLSALKKGK